jgi:hypothetical protein
LRKKDFFLLLKLSIGTALVVVILIFLYFFSSLDSSYTPYYGDEYFYFQNARNFAETSSLKASFTYFGEGALLFGADAHGPGYPLLYGLISKVVGWHALSIPVINLGLFLIGVLALAFSGVASQNTKAQQVLLVTGSPVTLFYSITYLPELIHLGGGILLFIFCKNYLETLSKKDFVWLLVLILVLGWIRNTWFFALFGLLILPSPLVGFKKLVYPLLGIILPYYLQAYFHEQVPNTFSELGQLAEAGEIFEALQVLILNFKRNIYFSIYYSEGWFYSFQKIWWLATVVIGTVFFRGYKLIQFGLIVLGMLVLFNVSVYKNYSWIDIRLYTSMVFFLNLGMIGYSKNVYLPSILIGINLVSFVLILPLQVEMKRFRTNPDVEKIPQETLTEIQNLPSGLIYVSDSLLHSHSLTDLPILNWEKKPIRYILPYFETKGVEYDYFLVLSKGQLTVFSEKILNQ